MILISAGHNPEKRGASFGEFNEYDEATEWLFELMMHLNDSAVAVPTGSLRNKVDFINNQDAELALEIHFNSAMHNGKHVGKGCETLYCPRSVNGVKFARYIHDSYKMIFPPDRGVKEGWYQMNPKKGPDYFLSSFLIRG